MNHNLLIEIVSRLTEAGCAQDIDWRFKGNLREVEAITPQAVTVLRDFDKFIYDRKVARGHKERF
jgi:hypothetical protein